MQRSRLAFLLAAAFAAACGESAGPVESWIEIRNSRPWMEVGDTDRFVADVREGEAPTPGPIVPNVEFTWSSSDPSVVSIDAGSGAAVALENGTSQIEVCALGGCSGWDITVINPIAGVAVMPDSVTLLPYGQFNLTAIPTDADGEPVVEIESPVYWLFENEMIWSSEHPDVAVVNLPSGPPWLVEGVARGTTQVTAQFREFSGSATVTVVLIDLTDISAGGEHTCALADTGEPYCWGSVFFQPDLEAGRWTPEFVPRGTAEPLNLVALASGEAHACGLTAAGTAYCWGSRFSAALGRGEWVEPIEPLGTPVPVAGNGQYATVTTGGIHTCATGVRGELYCWGSNPFGQLGITSTETCGYGVGKSGEVQMGPCERAPTAVTDHPTYAAVSAGGNHTCGLVADGTAFCWGLIGTHESPDTVRIPGDHLFTSIASGSGMACGLTTSGDAYCWGSNSNGLGDGSTTESDEPVLVAGGHTFAQLSVNAAACGVTSDGGLYCWGSNDPSVAGPTPTRIGDTITWASVDVGGIHACGMTVEGVAYCWGSNHTGALGVSGEDWTSEPMRVIGQIEP